MHVRINFMESYIRILSHIDKVDIQKPKTSMRICCESTFGTGISTITINSYIWGVFFSERASIEIVWNKENSLVRSAQCTYQCASNIC